MPKHYDLSRLETHDHSRDSAGMTYVYPVLSRRAGGISVGINLNPNNACNWRCIYCQVPDLKRGAAPPIDLGLLAAELRTFLVPWTGGAVAPAQVAAGRIADVAISGNGEPTSAAEFAEVVALLGEILEASGLRGQVPLRLITNGSLVGRAAVQRGLARLNELGGEVWFKVDAGSAAEMARINGVRRSPERVIRDLRRCADLCRTWVQTCWFAVDGAAPDGAAVADYLNVLRNAGPQRLAGVLLYGLARPSLQPEAARLSALPETTLDALAGQITELGLTVRVSP